MANGVFLITVCSCSFFLNACSFVAATGIVSGGVVANQDKTIGETVDDASIKSKITFNLIKDNFPALGKITIKVNQGKVLLLGVVSKEEYMLSAVEACWGVKGVKEVINEIKVDADGAGFDVKDYAADTGITTAITSKLLLSKGIKSMNYTIVTIKRVVYILGIARSSEELDQVTNIAASTSNVEKVISYVKVAAQ